MPLTKTLSLLIGNRQVDLSEVDTDLGIRMKYVLEEPENFMSKQGADPQDVTLPATKNNDQIFNTFYNPQIEDTAPTSATSTSIVSTVILGTGLGYAPGDAVTVDGGSSLAIITILTTGVGGVVVTYSVVYGGSGYSLAVYNTTAVLPATGTGFQIVVTALGASADLSFREMMPCLLNVNGTVPVFSGYALLNEANGTDKPENYNVTLYSANGQWVIDLQNYSLWDCVSKVTHVFDVATVEASWSDFMTDEDHDYVYAPVRYRQPFDGTTLGFNGDNCVNIYHLRPSISLYWLIKRAFRQIGYTIVSQFMETDYFKGLVLPWTWGDFYDINSQLTAGLCFQACGVLPQKLPPNQGNTNAYWTGDYFSFGASIFPRSVWCNGDLTHPITATGGVRPSDYNPAVHIVAEVDWGIAYNTIIGTATAYIGGIGYLIGDTFSILAHSGTTAAGTVTSVTGTTVTGITITFPGDATTEGYAAGKVCSTTALTGVGVGLSILILTNSVFRPNGGGGVYVFSGSGTDTTTDTFELSDDNVPNGYDNFMLYSFDSATGTMIYNFDPPPSLAGAVTNLSINFILSLYYLVTAAGGGRNALIALEIIKTDALGADISNCYSIKDDGYMVSNSVYPPTHDPLTPSAYNFTISDCNPGDVIKMRLVCLSGGGSTADFKFFIMQAAYLNNNPAIFGVPSYTYNPVTQSFGFITPNSLWSPVYSKMTMTGFLIKIGNTVNFQDYDAFRQYPVLDMLGGVIDMFNMEIQSDNINKVVTMEPMFGSTLPTGEAVNGYFSAAKGVLDYSNKLDWSQGKGSKVTLFNSASRQLDLSFKLDGSDGGQTIWANRYRGVYLSNRTYTGGIAQNNIELDNGIVAGIPGAARYMLPNRFAKGNTQMTNRFFSAVMHCQFIQWANIDGAGSPATQLMCIFPDNVSAEAAISQSFTPKLAFYGGQRPVSDIGGWVWVGDPANPIPSTTTELPFMFAVNYGMGGDTDPILAYSDENIGGSICKGLMSQFYLQRFAIMRNGQLVTHNLNLNLNDVCNWTHQEFIMIDGVLYALIQIDNYNPLADDSTPCVMWKVVMPQQIDLDNSFPSMESILSTTPTTPLDQFDIRYAKLLLYPTDLPQVS